jgi:hypothetical protein
MPLRFQIVIDCRTPDPLAKFWMSALGYVPEPPPPGFSDWDAYWRSRGLPEEDLGVGVDSIVDPTGAGPRIWFQTVDEPKTLKNRLHFDLGASGGRDVPFEERKRRVEAEADRLVGLGATRLGVFPTTVVGHYAVSMLDPEGNEFDIN